MLSLTSIDFLKLNLGKTFQPILHFFARMSAQPLVVPLDLSQLCASSDLTGSFNYLGSVKECGIRTGRVRRNSKPQNLA
jgi:hypothetical protein